MKLHLPSKLRHAIMACMSAMVGLASTCATGTLIAGALALSQAQAADTLWNATKYQQYAQTTATVGAGDRLVIAGSIDTANNPQQPADADWSSGEKYGKAFTFDTITVEEGGQLYLLLHRDKSTVKSMNGKLILRGEAPTVGADGTVQEDLAALYIDDGAHSFSGPAKTVPITIDGYVTIETRYSTNQTFTNLTSTAVTDELHFRTIQEEGRQVVYTLAYDKDRSGGAFGGTIVVETPKDDGLGTNPVERVALSISSQNTIAGSAKFVVDAQAALWLSAGGLTIGEVDLNANSVLRNNAGGSQVIQNIRKMVVDNFANTYLYSPNGTTQWKLSSLEGDGFVTCLFEGESYNPSIIYLNSANITTDEKEGFTGFLSFNNHSELAGAETSNYGIYQNYIEIGNKNALAEASLSLDGSSISPEWTVLALEATDVYIGSFSGNSLSLVSAGKAPTDGSASNPSTAVRPESNAATKTLHMGVTQNSDSTDYYYGIILKNVNLSKEGQGTQILANVEEDPSRYIYVKSGTLELGSLGDFYRIVVSNGARAEIGFATSSKVNKWGPSQEFVYYDLVGNEIDLSDSTKIQGNVVLTDKVYNRSYEGTSSPLTVTYLDASTYTKDTITVVGANLSVFNPTTGRDAGLSSIGTITLQGGGALVSASPSHHTHTLLADPQIEVSSDIKIKGTGNLTAHGVLYESTTTGDLAYAAYNTTYTGKISGADSSSSVTLNKSGFGTVTLAGDMSDFNGALSVTDGTLVLSGSNGTVKNISTLGVRAYDKGTLLIQDDTDVTTQKFQFERVIGNNRYDANMEIEAGSSLSVTGENSLNLDDVNNPELSYSSAAFLLSDVSNGRIDVYGTLTMERMSNLSVVASTEWEKSIDVHDGGVFNAKGLWLQTNGGGEAAETYVTIHSGATLNIGDDSIGHANKNGKGVVQGDDNNDLKLTFEDGATLGVLNDCAEGWVTQRLIKLDGVNLNVNTQGYVLNDAGTENGTAKTITMGVENGSITKMGVGTLTLNAGSNLTKTVVNEGYLAVNVEAGAENYNVALGAVATNGNGSLLFDLITPKDIDPSEIPTAAQPYATMTSLLSDSLNLTVRQGTTGKVNETYAVLATGAPSTDKVNLVALVDDGVDARYTVSGGYGLVTLISTGVQKYGSDNLLTWKDNGESDFWANSTQKNWTDDVNGTRRFTNDSDVQFTGTGETVTVLDVVYTGDVTIAASGYEFTGTGSIYGRQVEEAEAAHKLVVEDGQKVTFSNTGGVYFQGGVSLGQGSVLRLEYMSETATPSWRAPVNGTDGILEVATGGIRTNVLTGVMGDSVGTVRLDNNTTIKIDENGAAEAAKMAAAQNVDICDGSRFYISSGKEETLLEAGDKLYLAGAGKVGDLEGAESVLTVTPKMEEIDKVFTYTNTRATILADTELKADSTIYVGNDHYVKNWLSGTFVGANNAGWLNLAGGYCSNGNVLTKFGMGELVLGAPDSSAKKGDMVLEEGRVTFDFNENDVDNGDEPTEVGNKIIMNAGTSLWSNSYTALEGGLELVEEGTMTLVAKKGVAINSPVTASEKTILQLGTYSDVLLNTANPDFEGTWAVSTGSTLQLNHAKAVQNATIAGTGSIGTCVLELSDAADTYYAAGLTTNIQVESGEPGVMKTLVLDGLQVYDCDDGFLGVNVSLVKNGKGAQRFTNDVCFDAGFNGNLTVNEGLLQFKEAPSTYNTLSVTSDDAELCFGYTDFENSAGDYVPVTLTVGVNATDNTPQTLLITETGATLNANLTPTSGGHIVLGTEKDVWTADDGLKLYGRTMTLNTSDKSDLTVNLSAFMEAGQNVDLFSEVGILMVDGKEMARDSEIGYLSDFFNCDDINLAEAMVTYTDVGTLRIKLTNATDGQYYEYKGGADGVWNTDDKVWATKDDQEGKYAYSGGAAYFTNAADPTTITLEESITAREMAVKNGNYTFVLEDGNDLTIQSKFYEKDDAEVTFRLDSRDTTDANGNPLTDGARLTVKSGMGTLSHTVIENADGSTENTLILGGKTVLQDSAAIKGVALYLDGESSRLDLTDTVASDVVSLRGDGTLTATAGELLVSADDEGTFQGSLLGNAGAAAGANTLIIGSDDAKEATATQTFKNVTTDSSWNLVNNGTLEFTPTDDSTLHGLTLTENSVTTLTLNTDQEQLLGLSELSVEEGASITLNSTGNAPIMSGEGTDGISHKVLGTFEDDALDLDSLEITLGSGVAYLMVDKTKPVTLEAVLNDQGLYDLVLKATVDDSNKFAPYAEGEPNAEAGAQMLWSEEAMTYINAEPNGDLANTFNEIATMVTSVSPNGEQIREALSAVAGSSTAVLGSAFSADVERQLKAIRNRTTTMGVGQCEVNENMPYYNAWINAEGNHRELDSDGLAAGYTHDSWGGTVGFDVDVTPAVTMGLALTAMYGDIESEGADKAEGDFDTMYLTAFARYAKNAWVHTFVATVGRADVTLDRTVNVGNTTYETQGETDGVAFGFMYEVGRVFAVNEDGTTCWQPVFNVALRNSSISGYEEEGSDAGLSVGDQDFTTVTFGVGARMQTVMGENLYNRASIFEARALLKFDAGDTEAETETALLNGDGVAQTVEGAEVGAVGVELGAGVTIPVGAEGGSVFLDASADLRSGYTNINGTVGYRVNF